MLNELRSFVSIYSMPPLAAVNDLNPSKLAKCKESCCSEQAQKV